MSEATTIAFDCPKCSQRLEAELSSIGQETVCPGCHNIFEIPASDNAVTAPVPDDPARLSLIVTTGNEILGRNVEQYLGVARGLVVRSPDPGQALFGGLKQIVGGNIESYAKLCEQGRQEAFDRMLKHAAAMKADAVIAFRYDTTELAQYVTEVLAYGTAVKLKPATA